MSDGIEREPDPRGALARLFLREDLNFLLTNRIPRRAVTRFFARFGRIRSRTLTRASIAVWQAFADDLRLDEAERADFESLHECFIRRLRPGVRPVDTSLGTVVSPCDAIVGAHGRVRDGQLIQAKGLTYGVEELVADPLLGARLRNAYFVTLRLQSSMYHRFHAPAAGRIRSITYIEGDTWNVNPIALARVERLFCKNERAVVEFEPRFPGCELVLVPIAAILVGGVRFECLREPLNLAHRGTTRFACDTPYEKGDELGRFEAGSTIVLFAQGPFEPLARLSKNTIVRVGQPILRLDGNLAQTAFQGAHE